MGQPTQSEPSPFQLPRNEFRILLTHGIPEPVQDNGPTGDYLSAHLSAALLPGHGTSAQEHNSFAWIDCTDHLEQALHDLQAECATSSSVGGSNK